MGEGKGLKSAKKSVTFYKDGPYIQYFMIFKANLHIKQIQVKSSRITLIQMRVLRKKTNFQSEIRRPKTKMDD